MVQASNNTEHTHSYDTTKKWFLKQQLRTYKTDNTQDLELKKYNAIYHLLRNKINKKQYISFQTGRGGMVVARKEWMKVLKIELEPSSFA